MVTKDRKQSYIMLGRRTMQKSYLCPLLPVLNVMPSSLVPQPLAWDAQHARTRSPLQSEYSTSNKGCLFLNPNSMICFQADSLSSAKAFSSLKAMKQADNTYPRRDQEIQVQKERCEPRLLAGQASRLTFQEGPCGKTLLISKFFSQSR